MPFLDHLEELRWRILYSLLAVVVGTLVGWVIVEHVDVIALLIQPIKPLIPGGKRSEEHTSELQSQSNLVCRLLLEKKKHDMMTTHSPFRIPSRRPHFTGLHRVTQFTLQLNRINFPIIVQLISFLIPT